MKKLLIGIISCFLIISCKTSDINTTGDPKFGVSMINMYERNFSLTEFDSICTIDKISNNLNKDWYSFVSREGKRGQTIQEFLYIKSLGQQETIYRVEKVGNDSVKVTKRITK